MRSRYRGGSNDRDRELAAISDYTNHRAARSRSRDRYWKRSPPRQRRSLSYRRGHGQAQVQHPRRRHERDRSDYRRRERETSRRDREHRYRDREHQPLSGSRSKSCSASSSVMSNDDSVGVIKAKRGEVIADRYEIIRIAGQGTFGTVFECLDRKRDRLVAVKAVRSVERYVDAAFVEIDILKKIHDMDPDRKSLCVRIRSSFSAYHGLQKHVFIVFEKLGCNLYEYLKMNHHVGFDIDVVRDFGEQLLTAVKYCHSLGLTHTDLKPENILLRSDSSITIPNPRNRHEMIRVPRSTEIRLIDFGGATFKHDRHARIINTRQYRAPEVILGMRWSIPSDIWSVACILAELLTGGLLFNTHEDIEHVALMERVLSQRIPTSITDAALGPYRTRGRSHSQTRPRRESRKRGRSPSECRPDLLLHLSDGRLRWPEGASSSSSVRYVKSYPRLETMIPDADLADLLHRMLDYNPDTRITAIEALQHPFICRHRR